MKNKKLLIFTPGLGAITTTLITGILSAKKNKQKPIGCFTQSYFHEELNISRLFHSLNEIEFASWDPCPDNAYQAAVKAKVLPLETLNQFKCELENIRPMEAVFDQHFIKNLEGIHIKKSLSKWELAQALRADIKQKQKEFDTTRSVMIWCASTEVYNPIKDVHLSLESFEKGLQENSPFISPSQIYCYAALKEGIPFANGAPNICVEIPALQELALLNKVPIAGSDYKTGQTLMKTIVAPGLAKRFLGVQGWFSTNILGNRDGLVLDDPDSFRSKEISKTGVLESILDAQTYPELYQDLHHKVTIHYYPPRGDQKEGWDNIDIFGWMNEPMQIKINFLCKDSILAAPLVLDLALLLEWSYRQGDRGMQEWLGFYFKAPLSKSKANNDLNEQYKILINKVMNSV